eukprot:TRINITY_DN14209_c0_g1_i13.p2 TRINITY_DN14209_c0_g1~~TRINITY_DN14209_c0_g1_i13.p2  ORF type:complete len:116 (-),score=26.44 TRINITY_DN14209_c0_g1_i13:98-445(-)
MMIAVTALENVQHVKTTPAQNQSVVMTYNAENVGNASKNSVSPLSVLNAQGVMMEIVCQLNATTLLALTVKLTSVWIQNAALTMTVKVVQNASMKSVCQLTVRNAQDVKAKSVYP